MNKNRIILNIKLIQNKNTTNLMKVFQDVCHKKSRT
jgi:hypothetical protein